MCRLIVCITLDKTVSFKKKLFLVNDKEFRGDYDEIKNIALLYLYVCVISKYIESQHNLNKENMFST